MKQEKNIKKRNIKTLWKVIPAYLLATALCMQSVEIPAFAGEANDTAVTEWSETESESGTDEGTDTAADKSSEADSSDEGAANETEAAEETELIEILPEKKEETKTSAEGENNSDTEDISNELSVEDTPYGGSVYDAEAEDPFSHINRLLSEKTVMGVLYLYDTYPLRSEPNIEAPAIMNITCGTTIHLQYAVINLSGYWFYVTAHMPEGEIHGYLPMDSFICVDEDYLYWRQWQEKAGSSANPAGTGDMNVSEYEGEIENLGTLGGEVASLYQNPQSILALQAAESVKSFPEAYRSRLLTILDAHPNWVFVPKKTGMTLDDAVSAQISDPKRNWVYYTVKDSYKGSKVNNTWYYASREGLLYYMNPVNFIGSEQDIFMFEQQTYNSSYHTESGVASVLKGTFMSGNIPGESITYARAFYEIGSSLKVSPYHLASRVYQEQGAGSSPLISGNYPGYEGYYNYFNVQATGTTNEAVYRNGLAYAKKAGWNTRYKSLKGGAEFDSKNYVLAGQDTLYLEKYNVFNKNYYHQYMQNASAPLTEAASVYKMYKNSGALGSAFVFTIPVYDGDVIEEFEEDEEKMAAPIPSVTFTQVTEPNLFYSPESDRSLAAFSMKSAGTVVGIRVNDEYETALATSGRPYYSYASFDIDRGLLTLKPVGLTAANYGKISKKVKIDVTLEGYDPVTLTLNIKTDNTKPSIKAERAYLYGSGKTALISLSGSVLPGNVSVTSIDPNMSARLSSGADNLEITAGDGFKAGKKKLVFDSGDWREPITVTAQVSVVRNPKVNLSESKLKLNTAVDCETYGMQSVKAYVAGSGLKVAISGLFAANEAAQQLLDQRYLDYEIPEMNSDIINLGLIPANRGSIKAGTYKFNVTGAIPDVDEDFGELKTQLSVTVIDKDLASLYKLSSKGSINLVDRADTWVVYTPKITNLGASRLVDVRLDSLDNLFTATLYPQGSYLPDGNIVTANTGVILVKAKEGASIEKGTKYSLELISELDNGLEVTKTVAIKPVHKPASTKGNVTSMTMYRGGRGRIFMISSAGMTQSDSVIERVELASGSEYFTYTPFEAEGESRSFRGTLTSVEDTCKAGKYKVKFNVYYKDGASNAKPASITVNVTVK